MPAFQFKIKGYLNETGEYSDYYPADSGTIIQFVLQHWFNESIPNNLDIVVIKNEMGDQLVIDHLKRDIFDYYLITKRKRHYFHKKTDIQFMFFSFECFFNDRLEDLEMNLHQKNNDSEFIMGDFLGKDFNHRISRNSLWKNLNWLGYQLIFLLIMIILSLVSSLFILIFVGIYLMLTLFSSGSQLTIYKQYYLDNKDLEVKLSRANPHIQVKNGSWTKAIPKSDIKRVVKYIHAPDDVRNLAEFYTEIEFFNGSILNLTCLLIPQMNIENKFSNEPVPMEIEITTKGTLKRKTNLNKYFAAIRPIAN